MPPGADVLDALHTCDLREDERAAVLERALARACLDPDAEDALRSDARAYLTAQGVEEADLPWLSEQVERVLLYRQMVRNNLAGVIFPVLAASRAHASAWSPGSFEREVAAFVGDRGPRSHHLRDLPAELAAWLRAGAFPPYIAELIEHESLRFTVGTAPAPLPRAGEAVEVALDRALRFRPGTRLAVYQHPVHELTEEDTTAPAQRAVALLVWRGDDHLVHEAVFPNPDPRLVEAMRQLLTGAPLAVAVAGVETGATATLLASLGEAGVLEGGEPW